MKNIVSTNVVFPASFWRSRQGGAFPTSRRVSWDKEVSRKERQGKTRRPQSFQQTDGLKTAGLTNHGRLSRLKNIDI
jgi:hypothetical protein